MYEHSKLSSRRQLALRNHGYAKHPSGYTSKYKERPCTQMAGGLRGLYSPPSTAPSLPGAQAQTWLGRSLGTRPAAHATLQPLVGSPALPPMPWPTQLVRVHVTMYKTNPSKPGTLAGNIAKAANKYCRCQLPCEVVWQTLVTSNI